MVRVLRSGGVLETVITVTVVLLLSPSLQSRVTPRDHLRHPLPLNTSFPFSFLFVPFFFFLLILS